MNKDEIAGTARNLGGKVQEAAGEAVGDLKAQAQGKVNQAAGAAQDLYGQAREAAEEAGDKVQSAARDVAAAARENSASLERAVRTSMETRPVMTAVVALGVGWLLGRMMHSS
jgi:uncharacterized protein YjbJ (UPF0337 family)